MKIVLMLELEADREQLYQIHKMLINASNRDYPIGSGSIDAGLYRSLRKLARAIKEQIGDMRVRENA